MEEAQFIKLDPNGTATWLILAVSAIESLEKSGRGVRITMRSGVKHEVEQNLEEVLRIARITPAE